MTPTEVNQLAAVIWGIRPEWPSSSLQTFITKNLADKPYHLATVAFVACAVDPDTKTPARVLENGPWWKAAAAAFGMEQSTPVVNRMEGRCKQCGFFVVRGELHTCGRKADAHQGAAMARQALKANREDETP